MADVLHDPHRRVERHGHGLIRRGHGFQEPQGHQRPGYRLCEGCRTPGPHGPGGARAVQFACRKLYDITDEEYANTFIGSWLTCLPIADSDLYKEVRDANGKLELGYSSCYSCPWGGCGYTVRYKDGSRVGLGNLRCTEAIPVAAEIAQTGENVGRTHLRRLDLNERLGLSDANMWFQGFDPMSQMPGILTEEATGVDWSDFGKPEFTEETS